MVVQDQHLIFIIWYTVSSADVILSALNSSVDSPIATADCFSNQQRTSSGDFELQDILEDVSCLVNVFLVLHWYQWVIII